MSMSFQGASQLGPASYRSGGEAGFRLFGVGATGGGSGTAMSLESSVLIFAISTSGPSLYTTSYSAIVSMSSSAIDATVMLVEMEDVGGEEGRFLANGGRDFSTYS